MKIEINNIAYSEELIEWLQPGNKVRVHIKYKSPSMVYHVRAIIDYDQIVYKYWNPRKQRWMYRVEWMYLFQIYYQDENIEVVK